MAMGELESAVMAQLWDAGRPQTVREVHETLTATRPLAYTTVMTVLDRLAKKDMVSQRRDGRAFQYSPRSTREQLTAELMLDALQDTTDPAARVAALQHFVGRVSPGEAAAIRAALDGTD
ncbi:BlaI/MecI/CopY family transcriptional regulator [Ruania zhangjianzhongii]|uniref:BlaI/MecI/CopY family transcriptional regulator n=1 Tax=Ruania zhangjianzhongii TaxID=2603206 RepID=UPI0011CA36B9|nr:BlaI/MecI/CopY family transcriptional regulator [Ruania zhangjianzhongii]